MAAWSISSSADGMIPPRKISRVASPASSRRSKSAVTTPRAGALGRILKRILVITPSVPSEPTKMPVRLRPDALCSAFECAEPVQITSPLGRTTSRPNT